MAWAQPEASPAPANGKWADGTTWYQIKTGGGNYLRSDIVTNDGYLALTNSTSTLDDVALWCFVGDAQSGYTFYNRAKGPNKPLAMYGAEENAYALLAENPTGTTSFDFTQSKKSGDTWWCLKAHGSDCNYWNKRNNRLAYWSSPQAVIGWQNSGTGDDGSALLFTEVSINELNCEFTDADGNVYTGVCEQKNDDMPSFSFPGVTITGGQLSGNKYTANISFSFPVSKEGGVINMTTIASFYSNKYWHAIGDDIKVQTNGYDGSNAWLWAIYPKFENGKFTYTIKNVGNGKYVYSAAENNSSTMDKQGTVSLKETASKFVFADNDFRFDGMDKLYLSINSSGDSDVYLGVHRTPHGGTDCHFSKVKTISPVAEFGEKVYYTLSEAVDAAKAAVATSGEVQAITLLANYEGNPIELPIGVTLNNGAFNADNVTVKQLTYVYNFVYDETVKATQEGTVALGTAFPAVKAENKPFGVELTNVPTGNVALSDVDKDGKVIREITVTISGLPFVAAADNASIENWYYIQMHSFDASNTYNKYIQSASATEVKWADNSVAAEKQDACTWAFIGNPYDGFKVVNYATSTAIAADGNAPVLNEAGVQWIVTASSHKPDALHFCLKFPNGEVKYLNANAEYGTLGFWQNPDAGSTMWVTSRNINSEVTELTTLVNQANDLVKDWSGKVGELTEESKDAVATAITTAQAAISSKKNLAMAKQGLEATIDNAQRIEAPSFDGEGTAASPYIINNVEMLAALRDAVNGGETFEGKYFKLTSDIALNGEWTTIGNGSRNGTGYTGNAFKGVFDGDGKTISGLTISSTTGAKAAIGLFGVVDGGTVKNVNLTDVNVNVASSDLAGAAIGMMLNGATAEGITVSGAVVGHDGVGGIVGRLIINGTIANCTNNASVTSNYGGIGGIVGKAYYDDASNTSIFATIEGCTNNGTITAPMYVGGIAGLARANVANCVNEGAIVGGTQTGGIIGQLMAAGTVSGNENKAKVSGKNHLGGIIGDYSQSNDYHYYNVTIANNINRGELAATEQCAAIMGCNNIDGFTAMTATGNQSFYFTQGLELFGNPEDMVIDATNKFVVPVAQVGEQTFYTFAEAAAAAQAGSEIKLLANIEGGITVPANVTLNGNGFAISGGILAKGDITFAGVTTAADFDAKVTNTVVNIPAGASLQLTGGDRLVIGHGATFNITGTIADAKTADKATLVPSLKIAAGASITGNGVTFNVKNAYIVAEKYCSSKNSNANGTFDFNIENSIWEQSNTLVFSVPTSGMDPVVNFELKNSVLTTTSHLVFGVSKGEVIIDNSLVNQGTSRQLENRSTMTIKNGSVVNGAVATSENAKNPGTIIVENATYAVTGEFSGAAEGKGTLIIKKGATVSVGSIKAGANVTVDAEGMTAGEEINFTANLSQFGGTLTVVNNDKLDAQIVDGKVVLVAKPVAKIGEQGYATLDEAFAAAAEGQTITLLDDATPALTSQRAITKAAVIDLGGKTLTLTEDDLYFGTTTFKNGTIVVDPSVKASTAVFWMFANQTLTFDAVKVVATGVTGTYLIGLEGENSHLNLLNGSSIIIDNAENKDFIVIAHNGNGNIKVENSTIDVKNVGRGFLNGNVTISDSQVNLAGISKAGFRINAGQTLAINGNSTVTVEGALRDGGIHLTDKTAVYTKAATATVNATLNEPAKGNNFNGYTGTDGIWGETWGNAKKSFVIKVLDANGNVMGTTSLNNIGGIINGNVNVSWSLKFDAAANTDEYWTMEWTTAPSIDNMPAKVALWVDGVEVSGGPVVLNGPDDLNKIVAAVTDANGKILSCQTSVTNAVATGAKNIALLRETNEEITLPAGVELNKNGFTAAGVTVKMVAKVGNTEYSSIDKAIAAWTNGTVLTLLDNVTLSDVIKLSSTEMHTLDLGTYTMTAANRKNAIEIVNNGRSSASYALDIKADAENPGGITATSATVVKTTGKSGVKDRPIIRFYNGVFNANNIIQHSGSNGTNSPQFVFYNGVYNGNISTNRAICIFEGGTFNGKFYMSVDSSSYARIGGGTFKYMDNLYGSALNSDKFTIGSAKGVFDRGVYVDDNGCVVIGGAVVTEAGNNFEASSTNVKGAGSYLDFSSAKNNGLYYTSVKEALADNNTTLGNVTVYADEIDMTGITYKGTITIPAGESVKINNAPADLKVATTNGNIIVNNNGTYESKVAVAKIGETIYTSLADALAAAKAANLTDVVITIIGENTAATADNFGLYDETLFNNVTLKQENGGKAYYINELHTGSRTDNGEFVFDGVNIVVTGQYINQCKTVLKNNSMLKRSNDTKNFIMGDMVIEPGSKYDGQIDAIYDGSITVDGGKTDGTYNAEFDFKSIFFESYYPLIVKNGAYVVMNAANEIGTWTLERGVSQILASKLEVFNTITLKDAATLVLDAKSIVTAKAVTGAGNIKIDATGMVAGDVVNLTADLSKFTGTFTVLNNDKLDAQIVDGKIVLAAKPVAKIGEQGYATLEEAFKAATSDCTIEILSDVTVDYAWDARKTGAKFTVPVTINGNGKTIKFTASVNDNNYQAPFRFEADATVKNLTIDMSEVTDNRFRAISSKGNLTVDGCKFIGKDESLNCRAIIFGEGAGANVGNLAVAITNSKFINWKRGITDNENGQDVKTATITGNTLENAAVYVSAYENVTFTGNTVAGAYVDIRSNTANSSLNVTATGNTLEENTDTAYNYIKATGNIDQEGFKVYAVAKIGDVEYTTIEKAYAALQEGDEIVILKKGSYALKVKNNITITGAVEGVEFANIGAFGCNGANVTFNNVTFTYAENSTYKGLQHSGNLVYNNCTFNGQVFLYGQSETFNNCTFNTSDSNNYNVWTYGAKNVAFNECTFNSAGKSVLIYSEQASNANNVTVTKSQFIATQAVEGKAAIEMDSSLSGAISLTIDGETTAAGFGTGNVSGNSLWNNKKGNNDVANNDITVKVGDTVVLAPIFEAQIDDAQYRFFQDAINAVQNGETITVLRDIATNVEIKEKDNVKVTIDGNGMKMTGTIKVVALSSDNDRRITIKNFKFEDTTSASVDFITSVETNHYPRLTVEGCTFTDSGDATDVALRLKSSKNVEIKNCTGKGLHSFLQNTSGWNLTIEGVTVTDSKSAFALGTVQGVTIKGVNVDVQGYGIRMDAQYNNNAVLENNTVKAFIPVVVRKATVNSNVTFNGDENAYTATNEDGIWCAVGTSEYEANGAMPTAATGNVVVALNDADLDSKGIYGNALAGQGTAEAPYLINNIGELVLFRNSVNAGETKYNAEGVYVALAADIELASVENWSPIGTFDYSFDGNFDGQGHVIKNLKITDNTAANGEAYLGFFGVTANNVIKNFVIENVTIASEGQIVAAAIAYPYYTTVSDITVRGDIAIKGGNYTAGVLAYTRLCQNASNLAVVGNEGSYIKGAQVVGGVIADIQMNKGLVANYSNFSAEGVTVSGTKNVGGISGIIATQTLNGATVKNVTLNSDNAGVGIVAGCLGGTSTISNVTYENVDGATALIGNTYNGTAIEAKIDNTYYATLDAALDAEGEATVELFVPVTVATGESRVIELNGKTVIGTDNATGSFALININPEAELTINGEGAIKLTATNNRGWNAYSSVISNQRGKLTVNGGTIEHLGGTDMAYAIDNLTNTGAQNAETVINGGTVKSTYRAIRQFLNSTSAQNVLAVNGGTIEGANKSIWMQGANAKANPGALTVAAAAAIKGDVYLTTAAGTAEYPVVVAVAADALKDGAQVLTSNVPADFAVANVNGTWTKVAAAASLNGKGYATLRAAVEAAQNGETVELLANVTLAGGYEDATEGLRIEREITLNGNGHTIDCGTFQKGIRIYNLGTDGDFQVNFNNVEVVNNVANGRCIDTRSHDINLTITDSKLIAQNGNSQPLTIGGDKAIQRVKLDDAIIDAGNSGYGVIAFVPVKQNIYAYDDTKVTGYAAFYLKDHGNANIKLSLGKGTYIGKNIHSGASNAFGTVVLEGDNNVLQIIGTNPTLKAITEGNASQAVVLVIGANNKVSLESESATIDIVGENAYYGMISAENAGTTTIINKGNTMFPVAEVGGFQFMTIEEAIRYAGNEGTIKIVNDFVLAEAWTVAAGQNIKLDLNGKTVSYTSAVAGEDMITNRGNLTITDSSDAKTGKLAYVNTDATASNVTVSTISTEAGSTLVVDGGTIENKTVKADGSSIYSYAIDILTNGNLGDVNVTINGGTVYSDYMAIRQFNNGTACKNSLTINGGYIYGAKRAVQVHMDNNAAVTAIKGGKVEAGAEGYALCNFAATGNLEVTGGEFIGAVYSARENFISGGIYDAEVYAGYCAEGYMPNKNVDGTYGVVLVANAYASIDGVTYGSLKAAITAAKAGETITLLQDVKENVTISKNLTLDGAGKTITGMITTDGKSLKVTIKNVNFDGDNGTIGYAMRADDNLNLVVENCSASNYLYGLLYANKSNDNIVVKNVTVENCAEYGAYLVSFNNATFENFTVKGNTKYGIAVANAGARTVNLKNVTFEGAELPLNINENGTAKVTVNFSGINDMGKAEYYTSQYVNVVAAAQVGTKVCGSLQDAVVAANDGETVKVLADVNMTTANFVTQVDGYATLVNVAGKAVTIDLNGKKVTVNAANADLNGKAKSNMLMSVFHADPNGTLTLTDSSAEGTGTVELFANDATVYALIVSENANDKSNPGKIIVNGGNYIADRLTDSMIFADINEVITVNGGNFHLDNVGEGPKGNGSPWIFNASGNNQMHINVNGGTYNANVAKQHWTNEVKLGEGLTTTNNGDGTWTVVPGVATVGEELFGSIQEAIDAAQNGETVKLIADVALDTKKYTTQVDNLVVLFNVKGKAVTFDLNGKKIDVNASAANLGGKMLAGVFSADVEGDFTITDSSAEGTGAVNVTVNDAKVYSVFISENAGDKTKSGKMTVNAGNFTTVGKVANAMIYADTDKVVTINGGTFICDGVSASENYPWFVNTLGNNEMQVTVNGGTFNIDINHQYRPFEVFVPENLAVKANGNGTWTIVPAQAYVTELLGEWVNEAGSREHNVGYATVAEAIAATNELGKTVTILAGDYTGNLNINKGVTVKGEVDENGNNLVTFNGKLNITADGATVKNINVNNGGNSAAYVGAKDVVVDGCQVVGGNGFRSCYTSGTVTFKNSVITGATYGIHFDGSANGNIVIENCTITGWTSFASTIENVTISGTTFAEGNYNQLRLYQNATITECTFNEKMNIDFGKNGTTAAFENCTVANGGNILDVIYIADIAEMGIEVTVDGVPVSVAAKVDGKYYLSLQAAIDAATEGQIVTIVSDIALTEGVTVAADDNIFIDLNGKTVSMETAEAAVAALIKNNGTLTIESSVDGGKLSFLATAPSAANAYASNTISNYGTLTINGGTVENLSTGGACYALDNYAGSTANINGGKLTAEKTAVRIFNWTNGEANAAELNVVGGEIISNDGYGININAGNAPYVALNISGGTITTNDTDYNLAVYVVNKNSAENFTANISGGTFNGNFALNGVTSTTMVKGNVSVIGGTFDGVICYGEPACQFITGGSYVTEFTEDYLVYGYQLKANAETALYDAEWTGRREVVTIVDNGQVLEFANENDITVGTLTYKRRFGTAKNQSFYVPFEVPMSKIKDDFNVYYISNMHAYDDNEDAVIDRMSLEAFKVPANAVLKPNYPYIICAKQAGSEMNIVLDEATLYEAEENSIKCSSVLMEFEIMGVYSHRVGPEYEGTYLISGGEWKSMLADTYLCAFRLGMTITETGDSPYRISEEAMRSIGIRIAGEQNEDGTTTIYDVNAENGEEMIFDLSGRRVLETEKGIYIKGGKKFIAQ